MSLSSGGQATAVACIATAGAIAGLVYLIKPIYDSYCKQKRIISQVSVLLVWNQPVRHRLCIIRLGSGSKCRPDRQHWHSPVVLATR